MGRPQTQETKDKISKAKKALAKTPEYKEKMSKMMKARYKNGFNPQLGKKRSSESRLKMSLAHKGHATSEETKQKLSEAHKGDKHWNYKKDRTQLAKRQLRNDSAYKDWRLEVWTRDKFTCRLHSDSCKGKIEAHHILKWSEYPNLRYNVSNGLTLCHAHHPKKVSEEKRLIPIFQELVSVSTA